jgi:hypothetical protein
VESQIREYISKYYEGWTICDDPTCNNRTRQMGVYGKRCLKAPSGCRGNLTFEVRTNYLGATSSQVLTMMRSIRIPNCTINSDISDISSTANE